MLQPQGEIVFIEIVTEERSKGGIILPEDNTKDYMRAKVLAVGDSEKIKCKAGDVIIGPREFKGVPYSKGRFLINCGNILAVEPQE